MTATYIPNFIENTEGLFDELNRGLIWEHRDGTPRSEYWTSTLGRSYTYGKGLGQRTYIARWSNQAIEFVRQRLLAVTGFAPEGCFLNRYKDAQQSLGWHADDDPAIDHSRPIAVVSLGDTRIIQWKPIDGDEASNQELAGGSLLLMHAGMQQTHLHRIPKSGFVRGPRISLTFRGLLP